MTLAPTSLTSGADATNAASYTTASITPTANRLLLLAVANADALLTQPPPTPTVTGAGLTWVQVDTATCNDWRRITLFRAMGSSPSTGALTIDFGGATQGHCLWSLVQYDSDVDTSGTNGSGAIVQHVPQTTTGIPNPFTITLGAFSSVSNGTYGCMSNNNAGTTISPGSGFSTLHDLQAAAESQHMHTEYKNTNDTTVDWSFGGTAGSACAGVAVEIKARPMGRVTIPAVIG